MLGQPPRGDQMRGLVSAILRLGSGDVAGSAHRRRGGLRARRARARGGRGLARAGRSRPSCVARFRGPSASAGDLVDRLEAAQMALLDGARRARLGRAAASMPCASTCSAAATTAVERALGFAAREVVPRILRTTEELDNVIAALNGRHVPSGPSGQPDARARRRAPDRAQLLLRRPARAARPSSRGRSGAGSPTRCSTASAARRASCRAWSAWWRGGRRRCARRATTSPRSSR